MSKQEEMTDQQLNIALAELSSYPIDKFVPNYCNDQIASIEIQAMAIDINCELYIESLSRVQDTFLMSVDRDSTGAEVRKFAETDVVGEMLTATPWERAKAAYITLKEMSDCDQA
jgi:hypothetical protein